MQANKLNFQLLLLTSMLTSTSALAINTDFVQAPTQHEFNQTTSSQITSYCTPYQNITEPMDLADDTSEIPTNEAKNGSYASTYFDVYASPNSHKSHSSAYLYPSILTHLNL